jgi:hypothetical protein
MIENRLKNLKQMYRKNEKNDYNFNNGFSYIVMLAGNRYY